VSHEHAHGHSHGLVERSLLRSRAGLRAVGLSLTILAVTALLQAGVFVASGSVALLADLIHNAGDALTAVPLGIAFLLRSGRAERAAGLAVVAAIAISACVALYETISRLIDPSALRTCGRWLRQAWSGSRATSSRQPDAWSRALPSSRSASRSAIPSSASS
jgi:divalent metal cation (Fe/Co/Zn/Cd) transporter